MEVEEEVVFCFVSMFFSFSVLVLGLWFVDKSRVERTYLTRDSGMVLGSDRDRGIGLAL